MYDFLYKYKLGLLLLSLWQTSPDLPHSSPQPTRERERERERREERRGEEEKG